MAVCHHGRDQVATIKVGATRDGKITALHTKIVADMGAYLMLLTPAIPALGAFVMSGVYDIPAIHTDVTGVFTNRCPTDAIRGAGRPEATHMIEVMMDQLAEELGIDRVELRRRNFIDKDTFPHETALGIVYDSGDYEGALDKLMGHLDLDAFEQEKAEAAARGHLRGIGYSTYTEICGLAPSRITGPAGFGLQAPGWESAIVRVTVTGAVSVYTGTSPHGQGHETTMAQVVADKLGVDPQSVEIIHGDTGTGAMGLGTYGSRTTAVGTESIARATDKLVRKIREIVAHTLEASPDDIDVIDGRFAVRGSPDRAMALADIAGMAHVRPELLPEGMEPALEETSFYDPENFVFPFGAHACIVDVEEDTGKVKVVRYVAVDDCGPAINPMLIDGQVHGGIAQAIGQALYEHVAYDEDGQLVTGTFVDYALPTAAELPSFETDRTETPSPVNSLGVKGVGEAGTIAATPAVLNAVVDALRPKGVTYLNMPLFPEAIWRAMNEQNGGAA
jgi:carbon-monoxide dehydrogenase large subunit